jgi:hypothetical protein
VVKRDFLSFGPLPGPGFAFIADDDRGFRVQSTFSAGVNHGLHVASPVGGQKT